MALMRSNARMEPLTLELPSALKFCSSSQSSHFVNICSRVRETRAMQLTLSSSQHVLNCSGARLAISHGGGLSERIASSQFCSCSSSLYNASGGLIIFRKSQTPGQGLVVAWSFGKQWSSQDEEEGRCS
jgi:hypothetical protein